MERDVQREREAVNGGSKRRRRRVNEYQHVPVPYTRFLRTPEPIRWEGGGMTYWHTHWIPNDTLGHLAVSYADIFSKPPWMETKWTYARVVEKLFRELYIPDAPGVASKVVFLNLIEGNSHFPVTGFCWGAEISSAALPARVASAHPLADADLAKLNNFSQLIGDSALLFIDEIAVLEQFRGGVLPITQLCYPLLKAAAERQLDILCWSSPRSNIVGILLGVGFREVAALGDVSFFFGSKEVATNLTSAIETYGAERASRLFAAGIAEVNEKRK